MLTAAGTQNKCVLIIMATARIVGPKDVVSALPLRNLHSSKKDNGRVLIIGGSDLFHGAPILASTAAYNTLGALRVGAGYAITCVPKNIVESVRELSPNIIVRPLSGRIISPHDFATLSKEAKKADAIVIGIGIGREKWSLMTIAKLISYAAKLGKFIVIDADAIDSLRFMDNRLNKNVVLTPNKNEFSLLHKGDVGSSEKDIYDAVLAASKKFGANILLKGHRTVISDGIMIKVVNAKSAALATMGSGDVLSGIIGGFMALSKDAFGSALAGAYLHATIGDALHRKMGDHILASDIIDQIPSTLRKFSRYR